MQSCTYCIAFVISLKVAMLTVNKPSMQWMLFTACRVVATFAYLISCVKITSNTCKDCGFMHVRLDQVCSYVATARKLSSKSDQGNAKAKAVRY